MSLVLKPFHELLEMHFIIPPYQRGYRWESRQVEELLDDLLDFVKSLKTKRNRNNEGHEPYYCLQPITVVRHPENADTYFVVDGQQRLTTIYILMHYLSKNSDYEYPVYTFSLPSRDVQNGYLDKLEFMEDDKKFIDNIDNFYVKKAYSTIVVWFSRDGHDRYKGKIRDIFAMMPDGDEEQNDVRVIWYEINSREAHKAFRELNYGKIPLTSTELVKALLLQERNTNSSGHYSRGASYRRALEWDSMEHALQNPYLWSMLAESNDGTLSHMELVLDFVADRLNNEMSNVDGNRPVERKESKDFRDDFNYQVINEYLNVSSTNSKQSKLCVKCTLYIDTRLFGKHAVRRNRPQYVYDEIVKASVSGMLHLRNVFQFVVYRLYNSPFPKQQFVRHTHQSPLHVTFEFGNKLYTVNKHASEEVLADIALVCNQLSVDEFDKRLILQRFPVIDITRSYHEVQQLAFLVTYQMQFETEKPSHGTLAPLGYTLEYLVDMYPLIPAYPQRGAVHETYACAFSKQHFLNEKSQWYSHFLFKLHKTVV